MDNIWDLLYDYADIRDELEDALLTFECIHAKVKKCGAGCLTEMGTGASGFSLF